MDTCTGIPPKELKKMKKKVLFVFLILLGFFSFAENEESEDHVFLYVVTTDEMNYFIQSYNWLKRWENGEIKVSDKKFSDLYEDEIGKNTFTSMLYENFFRNTDNKKIQKQVNDYIKKNKLDDNPFEKVLLKKYNSTPKQYDQDGKTIIQYSYKGEEFDENINLFDFTEVHPFNDEFGLLLFNGINWHMLSLKSMETDEPIDDKNFILLAGGGTNSITIKFEEIDNANISTIEDLKELSNIKRLANKYKDNWTFLELDKVGVLENCGVDNYCIGFGIGPDDNISEIHTGDFIVCLYKKETNKVYQVYTYMNFSGANINFEIRNRLYNYLLFFTLLCYCD